MVVSWVGESADAKALGADPVVAKAGSTLTNLILDDLMLMTGLVSGAQTFTIPGGGWAAHPQSNSLSRPLLYKFADAGDVAAASFTFVVSGAANAMALVSAYRGVHLINPFAGTAGFVSTASTTMTIAAANPSIACFLAHLVSKLTVTTFTPPAAAAPDKWDHAAAAIGATAGSDEMVASGSTGTRVWTAAAGAAAGMGYLVPLREANVAHLINGDVVGAGVLSRGAVDIGQIRTLLGDGVVTRQMAVALIQNLVGDGVLNRTIALTLARELTGDGVVDSTQLLNFVRTIDLVGQGLVTLESSAITLDKLILGEGVVDLSRSVVAAKTTDLVGEGTVTESRQQVLQRLFDLVGDGTATENHQLELTKAFDLVGEGESNSTKVTVAAKAFTLDGEGTVIREGIAIVTTLPELVGEGVLTSDKDTLLYKVFDLVGEGVISEAHPINASRTFDLEGVGEVLFGGDGSSTITLPIDQVPTGGGETTIIRPLFIFDD